MRLISLTISGYRQFFEETALTVPAGLTGICGPNGVGKSKLVEAIGYAFFGAQKVLPASDKEADVASAAGGGKVLPDVRLVVESHGQRFRIVRGRKGKAKDCRIEQLVAGEGGAETAALLASSPTGVTKKVIELFGITPDAYLRTFVARQKEIAGIQSMKGDKERQQFINRMIGLAQVERALALADEERKGRARRLEERVAEEGEAADVQKAEAALARAQQAAEAAHAEEGRLEAALDAAKREAAAAREALGQHKERATEAQLKRDELARLSTAAPDLERGLSEAEAHSRNVQEAARLVAEARQVLSATEGVSDELLRHMALSEIDALRARIAEAQTSLGELEAGHTAREGLLKALKAAELRVQDATGGVARREADVAAFGREHAASTVALERVETNIRVVNELGPSGACARCGQRLGESFATALARLEDERSQAQDQEERARSQWEAAQGAARKAHEEHTAASQAHQTLQQEYEAGEELPGMLVDARQEYGDLVRALESYPAALRSQTYNGATHDAAKEAAERRSAAEESIRANAALAGQASVAQEAEDRTRRHWEENVARQGLLTTELQALAGVEAAVQAAADELTRREGAESTAESDLKAAVTDTARAGAEARIAEDRLRQARERQERLRSMRREVEVAERTANLIRGTRDEITAEACPRLSEMMDGWARSLMGPHFSMVRLTPEYRVEANNGSGVHPIDHFSGGEQTLLAVMLRVAISLYCQERAGMDAGFLILDEVFGDQDELHRAQLIQFLNEIKPHYHQILIVNHVADVTQMLDSIIDVEPTGERASRARLRRR